MFNIQPKDFLTSFINSTVIKTVYCSILHFEMYKDSLNAECKI